MNTKTKQIKLNICTSQFCIDFATSSFVFPLTDWPLIPIISSPLCRVPSLAVGELSKT